MKRALALIVLVAFLAAAGCGGAKKAEEKAPPAIQKVQLSGNAAYDLCVPPGLAGGKTYPLFFFLSPGGNPRDFYPRQAEVCLKQNCFFAASYNYRNEIPLDAFMPAVKASISDILLKQRVDRERVYLCGFSGGGMASYVTSYFHPGMIRGVISNDGALHPNLLESGELKVTRLKAAAILSGTKDTLVTPDLLKQHARLLEDNGIKTRIFPFEGGHEIAGPNEWEKAISWILTEN